MSHCPKDTLASAFLGLLTVCVQVDLLSRGILALSQGWAWVVLSRRQLHCSCPGLSFEANPDVKDTLHTIVFWRSDTAAMDECDAEKKERMAKAAAKKKALTKKGAVDSEPAAEGSERRPSAGTTHSPV